MDNESDKDEACICDLMLLRKTWLNMTRRIENINRSLDRLRQGLVTFAMAKNAQAGMHHIEDDLSGILEDINIQRKLSGFEYALGNIMTQVLTLDFMLLLNSKFTSTPFLPIQYYGIHHCIQLISVSLAFRDLDEIYQQVHL